MAAFSQCLRWFSLLKNASNSIRISGFVSTTGRKFKNSPTEQNELRKPVVHKKLESFAESLASRGYLRPIKPYTPPETLEENFRSICQNVLGSTSISNETPFKSERVKYKLLTECFKEFKHGKRASVHLGDVLDFYKLLVDPRVPLDKMKTVPLPPNLHIQYDYHRFNPDTDTKFGGISAFPKSSTLVTGLKYKKKYQGYKAKTSWP